MTDTIAVDMHKTMDAFILRAGSFNAKHPNRNEFFASAGSHVVYVRRENGDIIAIQGSGEVPFTAGFYRLIADQSGRKMGRGMVIGYMVNAELTGEQPANTVKFYVFK